MKATRRDFLKLGATIAGVASTVSASSEETSSSAVSPAEAMPPAPKKGGMLYRSMGRTGAQISALGVGGHHLGDLPTAGEAIRLVHEAIDGGITFFDEAKQQGKVRFVGFTGHKSPAIHLKMLAHNNPFDAVQLPLNCFDGTYRSFEHQVLPELERRSIAALGMKSLGGGGEPILHSVVTPEEALRLRNEPALGYHN